jgi:hypothetical protein
MAPEEAKQSEGLSLQTLIVAAVASGVAAVVVSRLWRDGTVIAAAMTPVLVTILKEALQRPMESEVVRKSASKVSQVATAPLRPTSRSASGTESSPSTRTMPPPTTAQNGNGNGDGDRTASRDVLMAGPRRTYGGGGGSGDGEGGGLLQRLKRLRGPRLKIAIVTGLLAFVIAVAALTLPELIFGGSVSSSGRTTFFGGGSSAEKGDRGNKDDGKDKGGQGDQKDADKGNDQSTEPKDQTDEPQQEQTPSQPEETPSQPEGEPEPPSSGSPPPSDPGEEDPVPEVPTPTPPSP